MNKYIYYFQLLTTVQRQLPLPCGQTRLNFCSNLRQRFDFLGKPLETAEPPDPLSLAFPSNPIHLPAGQLTIAPTSPTLRFRLAKTQIGIYMQVHGSAEARTHIIIDYNRNGIVNQIALNGSDFKMGFIIAGAPTAYSLPVPPHPGRGFGLGFGIGIGLEFVAIVGVRGGWSDIQCHNLWVYLFRAAKSYAKCCLLRRGIGLSLSFRFAQTILSGSLGWPGGHTGIDGSRAWGHMQTNGKTNETCIFYGTAAVCSPRLWAIISAISKAQVSVPLLLLLLLLLSSIV